MQFFTAAKTLLALVATQQAAAQTTNSDGQAICGSQIYTVGEFTCFQTPSGKSYACPIVGNNAYQLCGENLCYNAANYRCSGGLLVAATGTASTVSVTLASTAAVSTAAAGTTPAGVTSVNNVSAASSQSVRASASASRAASGANTAAASSSAARSDAQTLQAAGSVAAAFAIAAVGFVTL